MLRKTVRRGGITLALLCALGMGLSASPAAAQGFGSGAIWETGVWGWLSSLLGLGETPGETPASGNDNGGLSRVFSHEGAGFDPFGNPVSLGQPGSPGQPGSTTNEGAGFDPFGLD